MTISQLQVTDAKSWKGFTSENHLGAIWNEEPQKASDLIAKMQQKKYGMDIRSFLNKYPKQMFKSDADFTWELESQGVDNIGLIEARIDGTAITAADQPGLNHTEFEMVFPKDWFTPSETIVGHKLEKYPIRILESRAEGTNTVYVCELYSGEVSAFVPYEELVAGKLFSREYALAGATMSQTGREIMHKSHIAMKNAFSRIRIKKETPGNMKDKIMYTQLTSDAGKKFAVWSQYEAWKLEEEFANDINRVLMFGKSNKTPNGNYVQKDLFSSYELKSGAGLREQCETSNYSSYTVFDIEDLAERLMDMSETKLGADERSFLLTTGERGMYQFSKALEEYSQLFTPTRDASRIYKAGSQEGVTMPLGYGGQFVEFNFNNNIKLNVSVMQMYDARDRNKDRHPNGGVTESYRYDMYDIGTNNGQANIRLAAVEGFDEIHAYIPGLRDPFSPTGGRAKIAVTGKDGWEEHKMWQGGVIVTDPTRTSHHVYNG